MSLPELAAFKKGIAQQVVASCRPKKGEHNVLNAQRANHQG